MHPHDSEQISLLRFPLMLGVVLVHAYNLTNLPDGPVQVSPDVPLAFFAEFLISYVWGSAVVPMFFVVSGYLLYRSGPLTTKTWLSILKKRVPTLAVPYLLWNSAIFALFAAGQSVPRLAPYFTRPEFNISALDGWQRMDLLLGITRFPIDYQFWFIRDLILLMIVSPVIWWAVKHARILTLGLLTLYWSELASNVILIPIASHALLFFAIGISLRQVSPTRLAIPHNAWLVITYLALSILEAGLALRLDPERFATWLNLLHKVNIVLAISAFWHIAGWFRQSQTVARALTYLEPFAFFLFCAHEPLLAVVKKTAFKLIGHQTSAQFLVTFSSDPWD